MRCYRVIITVDTFQPSDTAAKDVAGAMFARAIDLTGEGGFAGSIRAGAARTTLAPE